MVNQMARRWTRTKAIMKVEAGPGIALRRVPVPEPGLEEVLAGC